MQETQVIETEELEEKYRKLFTLFDPEHCLEFREIIRRLEKDKLDRRVLVYALGKKNIVPNRKNQAAAIILVYHFLYEVERENLFRLLDCCKTREDKGKVEKRIKSIDVECFGIENIESLALNPHDFPSTLLVTELVKEIKLRKHHQKVEKVLAMF